MVGKVVLVALGLVQLVAVCFGAAGSFSYADPSQWEGICATGVQQSPIDLTNAVRDAASNTDLNMSYNSQSTQLSNSNGHTIKLTPETSNQLTLANVPGYNGDTFHLIQCHMHWAGADETPVKGSEHTVDGVAYAMELHCVHRNSKYPDTNDALAQADGLAVYGTFFSVGAENAALKPVFDNIASVQQVDASTNIQVDYSALASPTAASEFFHYKGSLTTPTCNEVVSWLVGRETQTISAEQLAQLRFALKDGSTPIGDNFRPVQPLNDRVLYRTFDSGAATLVPLSAFALLGLGLLFHLM